MPIYMDIHEVPGIEAFDAAAAHRKDMLIEKEYQCNCMTYWIDLARETVFCLIEAPNPESVEEMHKKSHGLIPHKLIEVQKEVVQSFLGRIHDPEDVKISEEGLKVFEDSAFRLILVTEGLDPVLLRHKLGAPKAGELLDRQNSLIRKKISLHSGSEVEHPGNGFIASFSSAAKALSSALDIQKGLTEADRELTGFKIGISAGEPVRKSDKLFGDAIKAARNLFSVTDHLRIAVTTQVQKLLPADIYSGNQLKIVSLLLPDEQLLESMFEKLEKNWQEPDFGIEEFCRSMSMSKSQLYRKSVALWGLAPNLFLKEFRLHKARELLSSHSLNISQTTFDAGFNSPSYFTKCFKKRFGILPAAYLTAL